jgi:hypothetical protein
MVDYAKGMKPLNAKFARGGPVVTSVSRFMKTPNVFLTDTQRTDYDKKSKGGELSTLTGDDKSLKPVKPKG